MGLQKTDFAHEIGIFCVDVYSSC